MDATGVTLTVLFDPPFWIGLFEKEENGQYSVCKYTFGPEPKPYEVYELVLNKYYRLRFSPQSEASMLARTRINPKRMQREISAQMQNKGIGTKAQQALKLEHEACKAERKVLSREARETQKEQRFALRQQKQKEKHRGH